MFISCPCPTLIQRSGQVFLESPTPMGAWEGILQTHTSPSWDKNLMARALERPGEGAACQMKRW